MENNIADERADLLIAHYREFSSMMLESTEINKKNSDIAAVTHYREFSLLIHKISKLNKPAVSKSFLKKCSGFMLDTAYKIIIKFGLKECVKKSRFYKFLKNKEIISKG